MKNKLIPVLATGVVAMSLTVAFSSPAYALVGERDSYFGAGNSTSPNGTGFVPNSTVGDTIVEIVTNPGSVTMTCPTGFTQVSSTNSVGACYKTNAPSYGTAPSPSLDSATNWGFAAYDLTGGTLDSSAHTTSSSSVVASVSTGSLTTTVANEVALAGTFFNENNQQGTVDHISPTTPSGWGPSAVFSGKSNVSSFADLSAIYSSATSVQVTTETRDVSEAVVSAKARTLFMTFA